MCIKRILIKQVYRVIVLINREKNNLRQIIFAQPYSKSHFLNHIKNCYNIVSIWYVFNMTSWIVISHDACLEDGGSVSGLHVATTPSFVLLQCKGLKWRN